MKRLLFLMLWLTATAQAADTYKCQDGKKITYSDEPCIGATKVDTTPTRGMGTKKGADVQRIENREQMANALKPLTGMTPGQFEQFGRRNQLTAKVQQECKALDKQKAGIEKDAKNIDELETYKMRKRFKDLRC